MINVRSHEVREMRFFYFSNPELLVIYSLFVLDSYSSLRFLQQVLPCLSLSRSSDVSPVSVAWVRSTLCSCRWLMCVLVCDILLSTIKNIHVKPHVSINAHMIQSAGAVGPTQGLYLLLSRTFLAFSVNSCGPCNRPGPRIDRHFLIKENARVIMYIFIIPSLFKKLHICGTRLNHLRWGLQKSLLICCM